MKAGIPFSQRSETLSKVSGYSLTSYGDMVRCEPRMSAYDQALRRAITPGCTVFDIGAGPGVFAILACKYGAGKVVAIEPDPAIGLLHQLARDNGFEDRIEIIQGLSSDYHPDTRADVIVSDLRGGMPLYEGHIPAIRDARERLLAPGGILIPLRDQLYVAAVESLVSYQEFDEPWRTNRYEVDLSAGIRYVVNSQSQVDLTEEVLLGPACHFATIDYRTIVDPNLRTTVVLPIERPGTLHGLLLWFDAETAEGATYSNAPGQPPQVYRQLFCPLERPLQVAPGDTLHAEIMANLVDGIYVWTWNSALSRGGHAPEPCFRQSTFLGTVFQRGQLASRSDQFVPPPDPGHALDARCLALVDGRRTLKDIAQIIGDEYPGRFASYGDTLDRVTRVVSRRGTDG